VVEAARSETGRPKWWIGIVGGGVGGLVSEVLMSEVG